MGSTHRSGDPPVSAVCEPLLIIEAIVSDFLRLCEGGHASVLVKLNLAIFNSLVKHRLKLEQALCQFGSKISLGVVIHVDLDDLDEETQTCHVLEF